MILTMTIDTDKQACSVTRDGVAVAIVDSANMSMYEEEGGTCLFCSFGVATNDPNIVSRFVYRQEPEDKMGCVEESSVSKVEDTAEKEMIKRQIAMAKAKKLSRMIKDKKNKC